MTSSNAAIGITVAGVLTVATALAQTPASSERPKFEVASVRQNTSGDNNQLMNSQPGGRVTAINMPLSLLIRNAYRLHVSAHLKPRKSRRSSS
jgi:hypothetical protein